METTELLPGLLKYGMCSILNHNSDSITQSHHFGELLREDKIVLFLNDPYRVLYISITLFVSFEIGTPSESPRILSGRHWFGEDFILRGGGGSFATFM